MDNYGSPAASNAPSTPWSPAGARYADTTSALSPRRLLGFFRDDSISKAVPRFSQKWLKTLQASTFGSDGAATDPVPAEGERMRGYRDRSHVDWTFESRKERGRVEVLNSLAGARGLSLRTVDTVQPWLVIVLSGATIGIVAGCLDVLAEWLGDIRRGLCRYSFYLNQNQCCSGLDVGEVCHEWRLWGDVFHLNILPARAFVQYVLYLLFSVTFAGSSALLVQKYAKFAFHSGIPEVKTILSGYVIEGFFSTWTLIVKAIGLALSVGSGLSLGKEGPLVHVACCITTAYMTRLPSFNDNEVRKRELLSAASAAGVSVAFGAPLGGVLFVLEELHLTSTGSASTLWRSFVCAIVATVTLQYFDPFNSGKLVLFQVENVGQTWRLFEIAPWVALGILGGLFGSVFSRLNIEYAKMRRSSGICNFPVWETIATAAFTALISYLISFMRVSTSELVEALFGQCNSSDTMYLCDHTDSFTTIFLLLITAVSKALLTAITFGLPVPSGIFMPTIAIGACVGRAVGIFMNSLHQAYPAWWLFSACPPEDGCISPAVYAVIGAASFVGGQTRMTISLVVIIFELTGAIELVLQTMLAVMISKFVADRFSTDGIYEAWIDFCGYPYLSPKEIYRHDEALAGHLMTRPVHCLRATGWTLDTLEEHVDSLRYRGYPIIRSDEESTLLGYIPSHELKYALAQARRQQGISGPSQCHFFENSDQDFTGDRSTTSLNLNRWVDQAPFTLSPQTPMEIVFSSFQNLGLRCVLLTNHGSVAGILTKRDIHVHMRTSQYQANFNPSASMNPSNEAYTTVSNTSRQVSIATEQ